MEEANDNQRHPSDISEVYEQYGPPVHEYNEYPHVNEYNEYQRCAWAEHKPRNKISVRIFSFIIINIK